MASFLDADGLFERVCNELLKSGKELIVIAVFCVVRPDPPGATLLARLGLDLPQRLRLPPGVAPTPTPEGIALAVSSVYPKST